jgi:hypothetical protein
VDANVGVESVAAVGEREETAGLCEEDAVVAGAGTAVVCDVPVDAEAVDGAPWVVSVDPPPAV